MTRLLALFALCCSSALAQTYPAKPITLIIPFPPGGSTDIVGRIAAEGMGRELGQPFVVDNRGGAAGAIGAKAIADAAPDGYTLGIATISTRWASTLDGRPATLPARPCLWRPRSGPIRGL